MQYIFVPAKLINICTQFAGVTEMAVKIPPEQTRKLRHNLIQKVHCPLHVRAHLVTLHEFIFLMGNNVESVLAISY